MFNTVLEVLKPWAIAASEGAIWFFKEFWLGIKAIFDNIVVLAVVVPLVIGTWGYTRLQDQKIIHERQHTINQLVDQVKCLRAKKCK